MPKLKTRSAKKPRPGTKSANIYDDIKKHPHWGCARLASKNSASPSTVYRVARRYGLKIGKAAKRKKPTRRRRGKSPAAQAAAISAPGLAAGNTTAHGDDYGSDIGTPVEKLEGDLAKKGKALEESQRILGEQLDEMFAVGDDGTTNWRRFLTASTRVHTYSRTNKRCILFGLKERAGRDPDFLPTGWAASASRWEELGRTLKDDAEGILVWVPYHKKVDDVDDEDEEEQKLVLRFSYGGWERKARVYDMADTEGPAETEELFKTGYDLERERVSSQGEREAAFVSGLNNLLAKESVKLIREPAGLLDGADGWYDLSTDTICVKAGMSPLMEAVVIAHELGHRYDRTLQRQGLSYYRKYRAACETVAESVCHALCTYFGVDVGLGSAIYLADWKPKRQKEARNIYERVEEAYTRILDIADPAKKPRYTKKGKRNV